MNITFDDFAHEYRVVDGVKSVHIPSITQLIEYCGVTRPTDYEIPQKYADRGTEVHNLTELIDKGLYDHLLCSAESVPFMLQYELFLMDHDVELIQSEEMVFNEDLFIIGRFDRLWTIDGKKHLTDIKTTSAKLPYHCIQVAFYALAVGGSMQISNLYLHECDYKLHTWTEAEAQNAVGILEAMSKIYWFAHPRDYKALMKIKENQK